MLDVVYVLRCELHDRQRRRHGWIVAPARRVLRIRGLRHLDSDNVRIGCILGFHDFDINNLGVHDLRLSLYDVRFHFRLHIDFDIGIYLGIYLRLDIGFDLNLNLNLLA